MSGRCLNCEAELHGPFCHNCGQKSSTHRITFSKFIGHDLVHGVFHLDKGIFYTLRTLIFTPGQAARSFLMGKRVKHYNIFALYVIIITLKSVIDYQLFPEETFMSNNAAHKHSDEVLNNTVHHYYKLLYLLIVPLLAAFSFMILKRLKYNYTEHIVLSCFFLTGAFFYALLLSVIAYCSGARDFIIYGLFLVPFYLLMGFYQATIGEYSFLGFLWRSLLLILLFLASLMLALILIIVIFYNNNFEGSIGFS